MNATRYQVSSTSEYLSALLTQIGNGVSDVRLFATHKDETKGGFDPHHLGPLSTCHSSPRSFTIADGGLSTTAICSMPYATHELQR